MIFTPPRLRLFTSQELDSFEQRWPQGVTAQQVVALFQERGIRFSEATFRKYVQLGLLPTSRRVGRKGKHRGSQGVYPVTVIRRINLIKSMMEKDLTLEQIRDSLVAIQDGLGQARQSLAELLDTLERRAESGSGRQLRRELQQVRSQAGSLMRRIEKISSRLVVEGSREHREDQGGVP